MKIGFTAIEDARTNVRYWSGVPWSMYAAFEQQCSAIEMIHARAPLAILYDLKTRFYRKLWRQRYRHELDRHFHKSIARSVADQLRALKNVDILFSPGCDPVPTSYLDTDKPIVFWGDATFDNVLNFLPTYTNLCEENISDGHALHQTLMERASLAVYASQWAADTAIKRYNANPKKVAIVPLAANNLRHFSGEDAEQLIESRPLDKCKLVFVGTNWALKRGDFAVDIAKKLNQSGLPCELTLLGSSPAQPEELPDFVKSLGFISKETAAGRQLIDREMASAHFLVLPTSAECFGISLCEANSYAVPCLVTAVGGVSGAIKSGENGQLFEKSASVDDWCSYIWDTFQNRAQYLDLAKNAFAEYQLRLNWRPRFQGL